MFENKIVEGLTRTGRNDTAVIGWGRGMGHQGHMYLASSVITQANESKADPYFVVSRTVGKDDPLTSTEKLSIYKKVFAEHKQIFQSTSDAAPDLNRILGKLQEHGYKKVVVVLGEDQVQAFQYLKNYNGKPTKAGEILYTFESIDIISRQQTNDPSRMLAGPRATDMRNVLLDPNKLDEDKFALWRDAMSPKLADDEVHMIMKLAEHRLKSLEENFADGKNPGRKGLAKRSGVDTKASVSSLRKTAKHSSGEKQRMAHWMANMKAGRAKNESEGEPEGVPHITKELLQHIVQQVGTEGAHAIVKSLEWGDGAAKELLHLIVNDLKDDIGMAESVKQRLDKSCWKGYRKAGTKVKGGVRVNNCVPTEGLTPDEQFDIIEEMVEQVAAEHGVDPEVIWEDFDAVDDDTLLESAAWHRKAGKSKTGGLNDKGIASYRREHPGSKLQKAVTTKPSKLKPGSKAAKRRKSFCARMGGSKGPMKDEHGKPTRKALALRKWNCHEGVEYNVNEEAEDNGPYEYVVHYNNPKTRTSGTRTVKTTQPAPKSDSPGAKKFFGKWTGHYQAHEKRSDTANRSHHVVTQGEKKTESRVVPVDESIEQQMAQLIKILEDKK